MQFLLFNIGFGEFGFVILIVIMFFGSKQIPAIARELGKGIRMVKDATDDIKRSINDNAINGELDDEDANNSITDSIKEGKKAIEDITGTIKRKL
jgi:sec-independent protein translocase protein TatA